MINKPLDKIIQDDLEDLIKNSVSEGKQIEYKAGLPGGSPSEKKEFLADVSSFANTIGGDLIFGIEEKGGAPVKVTGVEIENVDQQKLQLENIIRDGIEPRIVYSIQPILLASKKYVLIIRINQSWIGPHRVIFQGNDKFNARNSSGKYQLDTIELRTAFNLSETLIDKIKNFHTQRIIDISSGKTPVPLYEGGKIVLHIIPMSSFNPGIKYSFESYKANPAKLEPMRSGGGWNTRYNLDGFLSYSGSQDDKSYTYTQLFRNGAIEAVEGMALMKDKGTAYIPAAYEPMILHYIPKLFAIMNELEVATPVYVFVTLIGVKGFKIVPTGSNFFFDEADYYPIDKDTIFLPEILINDWQVDLEKTLKPAFDLVWNACGYEKSLNYDKDGNWTG